MFGILTFGILPIAIALVIGICTACNHFARRERAADEQFANWLAADQRRHARTAARAARKAEAEAQKAEADARPKRPRGRPRKQPQEATAAEQRPETIPAAAHEVSASPLPHGNNVFAGQVVSFTGTLPGMTRREAIAAVQANGGKAFETMPVGTTLLVVGNKPGTGKMDKADEWIATCRKITAAQFASMLRQPLSLELDEAAALIRARFANNTQCEEALS